MKNALRVLAFLAIIGPILGLTQNVSYNNQVLFSGGFPFPTVRVCSEPAIGTPCAPLASIFSDPALTQPLPNPFIGDNTGKYVFYAAVGVPYHIQVSGNGLVPYDLSYVTLGVSSTGGIPGGLNTQIQINNAGVFGAITNVALGSTLVSQGPTTLPIFRTNASVDIRDWGVTCTGGEDDSPLVNAHTNVLDGISGQTILVPNGCIIKLITDQWQIFGNEGWKIIASGYLTRGAGKMQGIVSYCGPAGRDSMFKIERSGGWSIEGLTFRAGEGGCTNIPPIGVLVDNDLAGGYTTTDGFFDRVDIEPSAPPASGYSALAFALNSGNNVENVRVEHSTLGCGGGANSAGIAMGNSFNTKAEDFRTSQFFACSMDISGGNGHFFVEGLLSSGEGLGIQFSSQSDPILVHSFVSEDNRMLDFGFGQNYPVTILSSHNGWAGSNSAGLCGINQINSNGGTASIFIGDGFDIPPTNTTYHICAGTGTVNMFIGTTFGYNNTTAITSGSFTGFLLPQGKVFGNTYSWFYGGKLRMGVGGSFDNADPGYGFFTQYGTEMPGVAFLSGNSQENCHDTGVICGPSDSMYLGNENIQIQGMWPIGMRSIVPSYTGAAGSTHWAVQVFAKDSSGGRSGLLSSQQRGYFVTGAATLSVSNFITATWPRVTGAATYDVVLVNPNNVGQGLLAINVADPGTGQTVTANITSGSTGSTFNYVYPAFYESARTTINGEALAINAPATFTAGLTANTETVTGAFTLPSIIGSTQCLAVNSLGTVFGVGAACGSSGGVTGTGTNGTIPQWTSPTALGNSPMVSNAVANHPGIIIGNVNSLSVLQVLGTVTAGQSSLCNNSGSLNPMLGQSPCYGELIQYVSATANNLGWTAGLLVQNISSDNLATGISSYATNNGVAVTELRGVEADAAASGASGNVVTNRALFAFAETLSTATTTVQQGAYILTNVSAASTVTTNYGIYIDSPFIGASGATLTHNYGLYIADQAGAGSGTNPDPHGIFQVGTAPNQLGGPLTLASITGSTQCLHVNATGLITGTGSDCGAGSSLAITVNGGSSLASPVNFQNGTNTTASNPSGSNVQFSVANATNVVLGVIELNTDLGGTATAPTVVNGSHITNASIPNTGLVNAATTVNSQTCTLGQPCTLPFQVNSVSMLSQAGINHLTSTANSVGLTITPVNSLTNQLKFEITGASYTGNAATATLAGNVTGIVGPPNGGTGLANPTAHTVCLAEGTGNWTCLPNGTNGQVLTANTGADPSWQPPTGGGGGGTAGNQFAIQYSSNGAGGAAAITPPVVNGTYAIVYPVVGGVAVAPVAVLPGVPIDATNPATLLYSDRNSQLNWTSGSALALPVVASNFASNMHFTLYNTSGSKLTITPNAGAGDLCNGAATCSTLNNFYAIVTQDQTASPGHWFLNNLLTDTAMGSTCTNGVTWSTTTGVGCLSAAPIKAGDTATGDLSGTYPSPTVARINGTAFSGTNGDVVKFGAGNTPADAGFLASNVALSIAQGTGICHLTSGSQNCTSSPINLASGDVTNQLPITLVGSAGLSGGTSVNVAATGVITLVGSAGQIPNGASGAFTATPSLGTDNSVAGTLQLANGSSAAHTIFASGATTSNTIKGPTVVPANGHVLTCTTVGTVCTLTDGGAAGGTGTVTVVGAGSLTSTALVTGGGTTTLQTPSATSTLDASGNLILAAGGSLKSADTGTPGLTFAANSVSLNQPLSIAVTSNQMVFGTTSNLTTVTFPASSGAVTVTGPNVTSTLAVTNVAQTLSATETFSGLIKSTLNGASSAPAISVLGTTFAGTGTTSQPLMYFDQATGSEPTTFNVQGTEIGFNGASGWTGLFLDGHVNGGASLFSINYQGNGIFAGTLAVTGHVTFEGVTSAGATGTSNIVFSNSPTLVTPNLGTPSALTLTNATGLPMGGIASMAADTFVANMTSGSASPTAVVMPTTNHELWLAQGPGSAPIALATGTSGAALISGGTGADPAFADFWGIPDYIPAANCNNTSAGAGWNIGSGGSVVCRGGTNNLGGAVVITDTSSTFAQTPAIMIPGDWDTATGPFIRFYFSSASDTTNGHTVIPQIKVSCPTAGDGTQSDDATFSAAQSSSTVTFGASAVAHGFYSASNVQIGATQLSGCVANGMMIVQIGRATDTATGNIQFWGVGITWPHKNPGIAQAN